MPKRYHVGVVIFDDVEVLDFTGPYEVFSVTRYSGQSYDSQEQTPFVVQIVAEKKGLVHCRHGLKVWPDLSFEDAAGEKFDIIVVPGGLGVRTELFNRTLIEWIQAQYHQQVLVTSVCTGALILAEAGLLEGKRGTTHFKSLDKLEKDYPGVTVVREQKVVDEGDVITSAGISSGISMSLAIVEKWLGSTIAETTKAFMEYDGL